jgi:hypothetical protein
LARDRGDGVRHIFTAAMDAQFGIGENGAVEYTATGLGSPLLALFTSLVRGMSKDHMEQLVDAALADPRLHVDLVVLAFQARAIRGQGKGERHLFHEMFALLMSKLPKGEELGLALVKLIPHYGYYKDLILLSQRSDMCPSIREMCLDVIATQLQSDFESLKTQGPKAQISMAGKYMPSERKKKKKSSSGGGSGENDSESGKSHLSKQLACRLFSPDARDKMRQYRHLKTQLNQRLATTEMLMAANRWDEINFKNVASLCLMRQRAAFLNITATGVTLAKEYADTGNRHPEDPKRIACRRNLLAKSNQNKVHAGELFPHHVIEKLLRQRFDQAEIQLFDAQWRDIKAKALAGISEAEGGAIHLGRLTPLIDVSGSMEGEPMHVAIALGLLVSELTHSAFRDRFITFESQPRYVNVTGQTLQERVSGIASAPWGGSTNFLAACQLILNVVREHCLPRDEVPDLIVFSDMQFDQAGGLHDTHYNILKQEFAEVGRSICGEPYLPPRIIFWNLRPVRGYPVEKSTPNTQLLSGSSPALFKLIMSGKVVQDGENGGITPEETLRAALDDDAFAAVRKVCEEFL